MDSIFKICKSGTCGLTISGLEKDNDEYLSEEDIIISTRNYTYSQSMTLNILTSINYNGEETIQTYDIVEHNIDCIDESEVTMPIDGLYQITHIILPTNEWLQYVIENDKSALQAYNLIYYYDKTTKQFMKYINEQSVTTSIEEILEVNAIPPGDVYEKTNTVIRGDKNTFCICHLNDCFYRLCDNLLNILPARCQNKIYDIQLQIYNRDIIWMAINVIKYLIEMSQYYEAQRILENITQCNNICKDTNVTLGGNNCGCTT